MFGKFITLKKLDVKGLCVIAMLIACTVVLSYISGKLRIGSISKFSISFIAVYVAALLFGPIIGGFVGAAADLISFAVNPAGAYLWQLTLLEFAYGFIFGLLFFRDQGRISNLSLRIYACVTVQLLVNLVVKTLILMNVGYLPAKFTVAMSLRAPACIVMAVAQILVLFAIEKYIPMFLKMARKEV